MHNHIDDRGCWSSSESEAGSSRLSVISSRSRRSSFNRSINSFHEETEFSECSTDFTGLYKCPKCSQSRSQQDWCRKCESKRFRKLSKWTSGNEFLDKLIKYTQNKAYGPCSFWEWIPYEKFSDIQYLSKGGFGTVFVATWVDGPRDLWDHSLQQYVRKKNCKVALKRFDENIINSEFVNELRSHYCRSKTRCDYAIRIYGISREPETNNYIIVMPYYHKGDIRTILREKKTELTWQEKFQILCSFSDALKDIHSKGHTHCNLHPGNIFQESQGSSLPFEIYQTIQSWDDLLFRSIDEKLSNISESSDEEVNVHPKAIYSSRPLSGIITQRYGLESTLSQNNSRKSISLKNSVIQDKDKKIKELIPKKRQSKFALTKRISSSNNDIPIIEIHKYDSEPSDEEEN
ncbi:30306_t:CDS:2 [Gigaspora margarita]|uniref:30306_t:CDS:1 n=1 Tax=Gigaspora margarita TaxID=4874 RepID=A0ABN7U269_GIGMA|nr:30306_t:CDS:2 [Gigaspora margarita]